jgi:predicted nucleotidyltransferase
MEILYKVQFGSFLYGTNGALSDVDYKGIYLPSMDDLVMGPLKPVKHSISSSTGNDKSKNGVGDIDEEFWSLQYFLSILKKSDTGALDLLFSRSNSKSVLFDSGKLDPLFSNPLKLFNPKDINTTVRYCMGQAKKYGIKGSRMGILKNVLKIIKNCKGKLNDNLEKIINECKDESYCFIKNLTVNDKPVPSLMLCGKVHHGTIQMEEFENRVSRVYQEYGERARLAEENKGIDWKAVSHGVRSAIQCKQILTEGKVTFPLEKSDLLKRIKSGECHFNDVEKIIVEMLYELDELQKISKIEGGFDEEFVKEFVISLYYKE